MDYTDVETGDILLFSGVIKESVLIQIGTRCKYSHVGIAVWLKVNESYDVKDSESSVIKYPQIANNDKGSELFVFESNSGSSYDVLTQKSKFGCRLIRLSDIMIYYDEIAVRKVNLTRDQVFYQKLHDIIYDYKDIDYDTSPFNLLLAPMNMSITSDTKNTFCSELAADYLYKVGAIPEYRRIEYLPRYFIPKDFYIESEKIPTGTFSGESKVIYSCDCDFITRYGIYILLIVILIFLVILRVSIQ